MHEVSLAVRAGEIVGIGGLAGQGQAALFRGLYGVGAKSSGSLLVADGKERGAIRSPRETGAAARSRPGAGSPKTGPDEGLLLTKSVSTNVSLSILGRLRGGGLVDRGASARRCPRACAA